MGMGEEGGGRGGGEGRIYFENWIQNWKSVVYVNLSKCIRIQVE